MDQEQFFKACWAADRDGVKRALLAGCDPNARIEDGSTPLHLLAKGPAGRLRGDILACQSLLHGAGADPTIRDDVRRVAGHYLADESFRKANLFKALELKGDTELLAKITRGGVPLSVSRGI
jgi:hypothetical protein